MNLNTILTLLLLIPGLSIRNAAALGKFPSSLDPIPRNYKGPIFQINDDYPNKLPDKEDIKGWNAIDPIKNPVDYITNIKKYCLEGQLASNWNGFGNKIRKWYHAPWLHVGNYGREFIHGLTKEAVNHRAFSIKNNNGNTQVWALTLFNPISAYTIGEVWKNPAYPKMGNISFNDGSVIFKLLFTNLTSKELPYLKGTLEIQANITSPLAENYNRADHLRKIETLRLVQMDISVKDARSAKYAGWVYASFAYDNKNPGNNFIEKMGLVGVQWGNDPQVTNEKYLQGMKIEQSYITPFGKDIIKLTSYNGRLNGRANDVNNSCMSCHAFSQYHPDLPLLFDLFLTMSSPDPVNKDAFFRNVPSGEPYTPGYYSADYNFQLESSIDNFILNKEVELLKYPYSPEERKSENYNLIISKIAQSKCIKNFLDSGCKNRLNFYKQFQTSPYIKEHLTNWRGIHITD